MSFAVNASTIGMAAGGLGMALFSPRIDRRFGILITLGLLSIPTLLLSLLPPLPCSRYCAFCKACACRPPSR